MSKYEAIHFDMDGVIADTEDIHVLAEQQTCLDHDFEIDPAQWEGFKGRTAIDIFTHLIANYGNPAVHDPHKLIEYKTDIFLEKAGQDLQPITGVLEFLAWAREEHNKMSLVTSSNRRIQTFVVRHFGIGDLFDAVITGDDIENGKPHPEPYQKALGALAVTGSKSIVVEDSLSGIQSAKAAGCDVLAIATSFDVTVLQMELPTFAVSSFQVAKSKLLGK